MPKIGYRNAKKTRHVHKDGFKHFVVHNVRELDVLMMQNRTFAAVIGHAVSSKKRKDLVERAQQINVRIVNSNARLRSEENE